MINTIAYGLIIHFVVAVSVLMLIAWVRGTIAVIVFIEVAF